MVEFPIDKYLAQDYRNTLRTHESPQNIETTSPLIPVIDIQKGFPKPNSKQRLRYATISVDTSGRIYTVLTPPSGTKLYLVGFSAVNNAAVASPNYFWDSTTSASPGAPAGGSVAIDEASFVIISYLPATVGATDKHFLPLPLELKYGLRCAVGGAGQGANYTIFYIEEII